MRANVARTAAGFDVRYATCKLSAAASSSADGPPSPARSTAYGRWRTAGTA